MSHHITPPHHWLFPLNITPFISSLGPSFFRECHKTAAVLFHVILCLILLKLIQLIVVLCSDLYICITVSNCILSQYSAVPNWSTMWFNPQCQHYKWVKKISQFSMQYSILTRTVLYAAYALVCYFGLYCLSRINGNLLQIQFTKMAYGSWIQALILL